MAGFDVSDDALAPILESDDVRRLVEDTAVEIADWAGPGYLAQEEAFLSSRRKGGRRWRSSVAPYGETGYRDAAINQTLSKVPDGL